MDKISQKHEKLIALIKPLESAIIAFSGGVDSALVLKVAFATLGSRAIAATADSPSLPRRELREAQRVAESIGARHVIIETGEMQDENYAKNPPNRCYFCKSELYSKLLKIAAREGISHILNGTQYDDLSDYRPGLLAASEQKILSPLADAGLSKSEVRALARLLGLEVWDKPASPCLSSRIPHGSEVTPEKLAAIEYAEEFLRGFGIRELRVRHFGLRARIETGSEYFSTIRDNFGVIQDRFKAAGFAHIELRQFRSGALNPARRDS
ncbi:MAG: ATP-dependent sacrificial sulfur transferase LarE [Deltaproteobacteria bacterium]